MNPVRTQFDSKMGTINTYLDIFRDDKLVAYPSSYKSEGRRFYIRWDMFSYHFHTQGHIHGFCTFENKHLMRDSRDFLEVGATRN